MKTVYFEQIVEAVKKLCIKASYELPEDVFRSLKKAYDEETCVYGKEIIEQCIRNAEIARSDKIPICQDTGVAVFFVTIGSECGISGGLLTDAINEGCQRGYSEGYLRASMVNDPVFERKNTKDNTPAVINIDIVEGDALSITLLPKGGGCENISSLKMLTPADGKNGVMDFVVETVKKSGGNPCPPVIVGVGIGGTADKAMLLSKKALLRDIGSGNSDPRYREMEEEILRRINATGNGPQGLGGKITALCVNIETFPCHIASLPVAVNLNCHAARKATIIL